jgi:hypothetical protein
MTSPMASQPDPALSRIGSPEPQFAPEVIAVWPFRFLA